MASDLPKLVVAELRAFVQPLAQIAWADDPALTLRRFIRSCGWTTSSSLDAAPITELVSSLEASFATIEGGLLPSSLQEAVARVDLIGGLLESVRSLGGSIASLSIPQPLTGAALETFAADVLARLVFLWLGSKRPLLDLATVAGLIEHIDVPAYDGGAIRRPAGSRGQLRADLLPAFLSAPVGSLQRLFAPDGWDEPDGAAFTNLMLQATIGPLARVLGGRWMVDPDVLRRGAEIGHLGRHAVVALPLPTAVDGQSAAFHVELELLSRAERTATGAPGPAIKVVPQSSFSTHSEVGRWSIDSTASFLVGGTEPTALPSFTMTSRGVESVSGLLARFELGAEHPLDVVIGSGRTGLTLGRARLSIFAAVEDGTSDVGFSLSTSDSSVGISTADFGSVVASILSFDASVSFDLGLEWSLKSGLRLTGGSSLELLLASRLDVGIVALSNIRLSLDLSDEFEIAVVTDAAIAIGPVALSIQGFGLEFTLELRTLELRLRLASPTRLVITITSAAVNGGGFLEINPETGRYAGGLALTMFGFGISAIVIVDTELPGLPGGWALFGSLGLTFESPIPLGFGFTLVGVGGLLALNRTMNIDGLASGLRTGAADSILFPDDIEEDAEAVLAGLDLWFPVKDASTVVGPVVQIGWGSPTLITVQLGIVVAIPDLIIALLGSVEILLPTPDAPLLTLRMDILGAIDLPAATVIVAASLHDSNLLGIFELNGDMGFYLRLSEQPLFLLSVGGYHPQFDPPGALPAWLLDLRRTRAAVPLGDGVIIELTSYFALTSNTFQFGGQFRLEASVKVLLTRYTAEGWFGVNVLLVLKPFKIVARAHAGVSILAGDREILGVDLSARLEGPKPWFASGRATFVFFGLDVSFGFDVGSRPGGEPREIHDVVTDVIAAMSSPAAWQPVDAQDSWASGVVMTEQMPMGLWARPDQVIELRQSVAPLNRTMTAYGEFVPAVDRVDVSKVTLGGASVASPQWLDDWFAPAQFDRLDDTSRLSAPSYELMTAGVQFGDSGVAISDSPSTECTWVSREPEESIFPDQPPKVSNYVSPARLVGARTAARTILGHMITVKPTTYTVVRRLTGGLADAVLDDAGLGTSMPYAAAVGVVAGQTASKRSKVKVVPSYAVVEVKTA